MGVLEIREVNGKADMGVYIRLQGEILKQDPNWVEPLHFERREFFSEKNPWFTHGRAVFFLAFRDGKPVGRISAQIDDLSPRVDGAVCGLFGALTAVEDQEVVSALLGVERAGFGGHVPTSVCSGPEQGDENAEFRQHLGRGR